MKKLFITGTNTGIGKTVASALLCRELLHSGRKVGYIKPIQTGCIPDNGSLLAQDVEFVKLVCGADLKDFCPVKLKLPASPHLAAAEEGIEIDIDELVEKIDSFCSSESFDYVVVEGAGGISVPLNSTVDMAELCKRINAEMIVVTTTELGTLNHTKLTIEYAKARGFDCKGIISSCHEKPDVIEKDNIELISKMFEAKILFKIPFLENLDTESGQAIDMPSIKISMDI